MSYCPNEDFDAELGAIEAVVSAAPAAPAPLDPAAQRKVTDATAAVTKATAAVAAAQRSGSANTILLAKNALLAAQTALTKAKAAVAPAPAASGGFIKAALTVATPKAPVNVAPVAPAPTRVEQGGGAVQTATVAAPGTGTADMSIRDGQAPPPGGWGSKSDIATVVKAGVPLTTAIGAALKSGTPPAAIIASKGAVPAIGSTDSKMDLIAAAVDRSIQTASASVLPALHEIKATLDARQAVEEYAKGQAAAAHKRALETFIRTSLNTILSRLPPSNSTRAWIKLLS